MQTKVVTTSFKATRPQKLSSLVPTGLLGVNRHYCPLNSLWFDPVAYLSTCWALVCIRIVAMFDRFLCLNHLHCLYQIFLRSWCDMLLTFRSFVFFITSINYYGQKRPPLWISPIRLSRACSNTNTKSSKLRVLRSQVIKMGASPLSYAIWAYVSTKRWQRNVKFAVCAEHRKFYYHIFARQRATISGTSCRWPTWSACFAVNKYQSLGHTAHQTVYCWQPCLSGCCSSSLERSARGRHLIIITAVSGVD